MAAELHDSHSNPGLGRSLATARWCAARGWPVHPLAAGRKTPVRNCAACRQVGHTRQGCACLRTGGRCHGFHAATLDPARIERWWGEHPEHGVGVSCGPAGLVVIDIDAHPQPLPDRDRLLPGIPVGEAVDLTGLANGFHTLGVLAALRNRPHPAHDESTLRVRTPSGGLHVWYRGHGWQCSSGSGAGRALAWQVDVRAQGGYIVAPGHRTTAGRYEPVGAVREPAPLPAWLADELARTGHLTPTQGPATGVSLVPPRARQAVAAATARTPRPGAHHHPVLAAMLAAVADCAAVAEGAAFSEKLNRAAYTAGGLVAAGLLTAAAAEDALQQAARHARPGQQRRSTAIIRSGLDAGVRRPLIPASRP
ncbi:bifunctional DNA primase/polymerase [Kitasatospora sp. LaBMicrA B282]|uniref:bifunctional DNA primase/polymerase n=1 Tax=Kitasatospora sp. LaBMicrA B282 TaxID=3420949 RepID=UPI003D151CA2